MRTQPLIVLLLVVALAVAAWFVLGQLSASDPVIPPPAPSAAEMGDEGRPAAQSAERLTTPAALVEAAANDPIREQAVPADGGGGRSILIRGRVLDGAGAPRPDTALGVAPVMEGPGFDLVTAEELRADRARKPLAEARTDAAGRFEFVLPPTVRGRLRSLDDDLVFQDEVPDIRGKGTDIDLGDVVLLRGASVAGVVRDAQGNPVADCVVMASRGAIFLGENRRSAKTGADGVFRIGRLRPGAWVLRTASSRFLPVVQEIGLAPEEQREDTQLIVSQGQAIAGQVVDDRGVGVAGMKVGCRRREQRQGLDLEHFVPEEAAVTDPNGYFTLTSVQGDKVTVRAFGPGHGSAVAADVPVGTGDLVLCTPRHGAIRGRLIDRAGTPLVGSRVRAESMGADRLPGERASAKTDDQGNFAIDDVLPGEVVLHAEGKGHRPVDQAGIVALAGQAIDDVRLVADRGAVARVLVVDADGAPVAGAKVRLEAPRPVDPNGDAVRAAFAVEDDFDGMVFGDGPGKLGEGVSDELGIAEIAGLPAGDAEVHAEHASFAPAEPVRTVLPAAGTVESRVALRAAGRLSVTVLDADGSPKAGVPIVVDSQNANASGHAARGTSDAEGRCTFATLLPGSYLVKLAKAPRMRQFGGVSMSFGEAGRPIASTATEVFVKTGEIAEVEVRLPLQVRLVGRVTNGVDPVAGCVVEMADEPGGLMLPGFGGAGQTTDANGEFVFEDVDVGTHELQFGKPEQIVKAKRSVVVPPGVAEVRWDLVLRTSDVRVRVVAQGSGEPVAGAEVRLVRKEAGAVTQQVVMFAISTIGGDSGAESTMTFGDRAARSAADGVAVIEDVPLGDYTLKISSKAFSPLEKSGVSVVEGGQNDLGSLQLTAGANIRCNIAAAGPGESIVSVEYRKAGDETWQDHGIARGRTCTLEGLSPGAYEVRATQLMVQPSVPGPIATITAESGRTVDVELQLAPR